MTARRHMKAEKIISYPDLPWPRKNKDLSFHGTRDSEILAREKLEITERLKRNFGCLIRARRRHCRRVFISTKKGKKGNNRQNIDQI